MLSHTGIPSAVQALPRLDVPHTRDRHQNKLIIRAGTIERIQVKRQLAVGVRPECDCSLFHLLLHPFAFAVHVNFNVINVTLSIRTNSARFQDTSIYVPAEQKRAESAGVEMIKYGNQKMFVELESVGELPHYLPDAIDKL